MRYSELHTVMPHRHPMLLVDRILELSKWDSIVGIKNVTATESCYAHLGLDNAPEDFAYPISLLIESFGQTGGVLINQMRRERGCPEDVVMLFAGLSGFNLSGRSVYPGDTMRHEVVVHKDMDDFAVLGGRVMVQDECIAEVETIIVAYRPAADVRTSKTGSRA